MHIHNDFADPMEVRRGCFVIEGGALSLPFLQEGQYYRIVGSVFNAGIHRYPDDALTDEAFTGEIRPMRVPPAFLALAEEIARWQARYGAAAESPYRSESFAGYSYSRAGGLDANGAGAAAWQNAFRSRLDPYRKLS